MIEIEKGTQEGTHYPKNYQGLFKKIECRSAECGWLLCGIVHPKILFPYCPQFTALFSMFRSESVRIKSGADRADPESCGPCGQSRRIF